MSEEEDPSLAPLASMEDLSVQATPMSTPGASPKSLRSKSAVFTSTPRKPNSPEIRIHEEPIPKRFASPARQSNLLLRQSIQRNYSRTRPYQYHPPSQMFNNGLARDSITECPACDDEVILPAANLTHPVQQQQSNTLLRLEDEREILLKPSQRVQFLSPRERKSSPCCLQRQRCCCSCERSRDLEESPQSLNGKYHRISAAEELLMNHPPKDRLSHNFSYKSDKINVANFNAPFTDLLQVSSNLHYLGLARDWYTHALEYVHHCQRGEQRRLNPNSRWGFTLSNNQYSAPRLNGQRLSSHFLAVKAGWPIIRTNLM